MEDYFSGEAHFGPGDVNAHGQDDALYQGPRDYTKTIELTQAQYEAMKKFGDNPAANGFSTDYNGLTNSCIDFTWKAMEMGGLNPVGFEGEILPTWNGIDIDILNALQNLEKSFLQFAFGFGNFLNGLEQSIADLFTAAQKFRLVFDPLTLDLDGDGLETTGIATNAPILFDHNADGIKTGTGWVSADDGMLVLDRNGNGSIDTGQELFGDSTVKSNGQRALDGFDALADLDSNADGQISSSDAQFAGLQIWRDLNQDGISQGGELFTLDSLGIASISTAQTANSQTLANENQIADLGTYTKTDGSTGTTGDINLAADTFHREFTSTLDTSAVSALPDMQGSGVVRDLREAANNGEWRVAA